MTLAEEFVEQVRNIPYYENIYHWLVSSHFDESRLLDQQVVKTSRWYERVRSVIQFSDNSLAAFEQNSGLTEIQEDTDPECSAYLVESYKEVVVKYRKI